MLSKKNNLPIVRGVIIVAGPYNPWDPAHLHYYVVNPDLGHVLDPNNNVMTLSPARMIDYWVATEDIFLEVWWTQCSNGLANSDLYMSGICAGVEDERF